MKLVFSNGNREVVITDERVVTTFEGRLLSDEKEFLRSAIDFMEDV